MHVIYYAENASTCGSEVPFQVQIKYTSLDGQQCLRVFTEVRPTTSDKRVANQGIQHTTSWLSYILQNSGTFSELLKQAVVQS